MENFEFTYPRVLSIAGSDSGGGAGIQADLKTFSALGCYGMTAITALTAQNTLGVRAIHSIPAPMLRDQIDAVIEDIGADAVKIGMLHSKDAVLTVADAIDRHNLKNVVFDPVMLATSGAALIDKSAIEALMRELFPRTLVVTPNLDEAGLMVGRAVTCASEMEEAALALIDKGASAVLLKGGHLPGNDLVDLLVVRGGEAVWMEGSRIASRNTHGTGCTLSSAMAAHLAMGASLVDAVRLARDFVRESLRLGAAVRTGQGGGPLNHGHGPLAMKLKRLV